jgi:ribosomal-protein-alanine N-acetyltransferase
MLQLFPLDRAACAALLDGTAPILKRLTNLGAVRDLLQIVVPAQVALYDRTGVEAPWIGYLAYVQETGEVVGACSFKGACTDGRVEIAYFTFPHAEGLGHGKAMAAALIAIAAATAEAHTVIACTLPEENASAAILRGLQFTNTGTVVDPDDGPVWRWELRVKPPAEP